MRGPPFSISWEAGPIHFRRKIMRNTVLLSVGIMVLIGAAANPDEGFKPDEEGFIRNWLVLAPLPFGEAQSGAEALGKQQIPDEAKLHPKDGDKVKSGDTELSWKI